MAGIDLKNLSRRDFGRLSGATLGGVLAGTSWATTHDKSPIPEVNGTVAPGFERVKHAFAANFKHHGDVGATLAGQEPRCDAVVATAHGSKPALPPFEGMFQERFLSITNPLDFEFFKYTEKFRCSCPKNPLSLNSTPPMGFARRSLSGMNPC